MRVAALQMGPAAPTIAETADRILLLVEKAAAEGVEFAVLPELALTPYFAAEIHEDLTRFTSPEENQAALTAIAAAAGKAKMALVLPYAEQNNMGLYNSMSFIDTNGTPVGTYRKVHIPGHFEPKPDAAMTIMEKRYFVPGDLGFGVHDLGVVRAGGVICYDRRFPESYRSLMHNGAEIIAASYNTPVMAGGTLAKARRASELAITGGAYSTATAAVAAGKAGRENGVRFIGGSFVANAEGVILAKAKTDGDEMVVAEIDMAQQKAIRERWAFDENRRPDAYVMRKSA